MLGRYEGQFANMRLLDALRVTDVDLPSDVVQASTEAYEVIKNIPLPELHEIALGVEGEIVEAATAHLRDDPFLDWPIDQSGQTQYGPDLNSDDQRKALVDERRSYVGDIHLWLIAASTAGHAQGKDALCLAVMALWKVVSLKDATAQLQTSMANRSFADIRKLWANVEDVLRLTGEVVRAGTLAANTANLNSAISAAHAAGAELKAKELQSIADQRLRAAAALGGQRKAQKYQLVKDRAVALYRAGRYNSRSKAATGIHAQLEKEGFTIAHSTVLEYLAGLDRKILAGRNSAVSEK